MKTTLIAEISQTMDELIKIFSSYDQKQLDITPFEGSWTAGQVAEHIIKSISNLPEFLNTNTTATTDRPFDAHVATIRNIFLDFNTKMQSPGSIIPVAIHHDKTATLESFSSIKMQMINAAATLDLTPTCKSFEMPGLGFLTRREWLNFFIVHTKRHTNQLKNICKILNGQ